MSEARVRKHTESILRLSKRALYAGTMEFPPSINEECPRPATWGECVELGLGVASPCPHVSCVHHLYLDVNPENGAITYNFPGREVWELAETCSLAVAARLGETLEDVGALLNLTRERARQIETRALETLRRCAPAMAEHMDYPIHIGPGTVRVVPPDFGLVAGGELFAEAVGP